MKRIVTLSIIAILLLAACNKNAASEERSRKSGVGKASAELKIAVLPTLDCLPLFVAEERGMFKKQGVSVHLQLFQSQMEQDTKLKAHSVDGIVTDLVRAERLQQEDTINLYYLTATNASWKMVTQKMTRIHHIQQMEDKMVAMSRFSVTDMLADMVIEEAKLDSDKVFKIQINDLGIRMGMLRTGIMDAMFLPEPQATEARLQGSTTVYDTGERDINMGVLAFRKSLYEKSDGRKHLDALTKAYDEACDSLNKYGIKHYREVVEKYCAVTDQVIEALPQMTNYQHAQTPRPTDIEHARNWLNKQKQKQVR